MPSGKRSTGAGLNVSELRERLRTRQTDLLRALTQGVPAPEGFDAGRLELAAEGLARKRVHEARQFLRRMAGLLPFEELFEQFVARVPRAPTPRLDGYRFCGWLLDQGQAGKAWRAAVAVRLAWREASDDARPRRWPRLFLARRGCALYWPGRGVRWV